MKQVVQNMRTGEVHVVEVPPPRLRPGGALVATRASLISPGTERSKIELGERSLLGKARARPELARQVVEKARREGLRETYRAVMERLDAPSPLGYSSCGTVVAATPDCTGISVGDLVACAGGGYANHAEVNFVPKNLLATVPVGVSAEQAAYATVGAIAMQGMRQAEVGLGDRVAVLGLGLVGLLALQIVRAAGGRVIGVDLDPDACAVADRLGAERTVVRKDPVEPVAEAFTDGIGVDSVLICASTESSDPVALAGRLCRDRGRVVVIGAVGTSFPRDLYYEKELELRLSRSYGPGRYDPKYEEHGHDYPVGYVRWTEQRNLVEFLRLLGDGLVDVETLTTHRFPVDRAPEAYSLISDKAPSETRPVGVLLEYPGAEKAAGRDRVVVRPRETGPERKHMRISAIGAGSFATRILLPALAADERVVFGGVATASGISARRAAERFGFAYATSDVEALLRDPETDAVVVATRHDSHAPLSVAAVRAGKALFCEKPLAVTREGLEEVAAAYAAAPVPLLVGFNRRYSPLTQALREALPAGAPRAVVCRVNADLLPPDHWSKDETAGGRIVGELCHFLDLACYLAEGRPVRVSAERLGSAGPARLDDSVVVQASFECGSVASIQYLANGDPGVPKERIEVFCGGVVAVIDDFRRLELAGVRKRAPRSTKRKEKGHREEMRAFVDLVCGAPHSVLSEEDIFWSSALTLQVPVSLALGRPVAVDLPEALGGLGARAADMVAGAERGRDQRTDQPSNERASTAVGQGADA